MIFIAHLPENIYINMCIYILFRTTEIFENLVNLSSLSKSEKIAGIVKSFQFLVFKQYFPFK